MAEEIDFVKVLKLENDEDFTYADLDPTEDAVLAKGFAIEGSEYRIMRNSVNNSIEIYVGDSKILEIFSTGNVEISGEQALTESVHDILNTLLHNISENHYTEINRNGVWVGNITIWTSSSKTTKIREITVNRDANQWIISYIVKQYDASGALKEQITYTISRDTNKWITSIEGVIS